MSKWYEELVGAEVIAKKYFHDGEESMSDMLFRIGECFSSDLKEPVKEAIRNANFFPGGRSLYALGCKGKFSVTTSNCYTLPTPKDDLADICDVGKYMAIISSRGGGVGVNLSNLRPRGAKVNNAAKTSTGAVSFMELYNTIGGIISQNGRRGALLIGLRCDHPDIEEFLRVKQDNSSIQSANISILFSDDFLDTALNTDRKFLLNFDLGEDKDITKRYIIEEIDGKKFFNDFCDMNKDWAEPGAIFIDRVRNWHLLSEDKDYKIDICNPCGEYFASEFNACNLGSINLYNLIAEKFTETARVDWEKLRKTVDLAVRALDEILDYGEELQPLEQNRENIKNYRAIGLGVFGLADALIGLRLNYGSALALQVSRDIMQAVFLQALRTSCNLAKEKGAFKKCDKELLVKSPILNFLHAGSYGSETHNLIEDIREYGLRNASLISIAPTGSIATMCGMSGGIEPLYMIKYKRTTHSLLKEGKYFDVFAKSVQDLLDFHQYKPENFSVEQIKTKFPFVVDSHDINPISRVYMQGAIQQFVDNAISSTVNMKKGSTTAEVREVYKTAWEKGCKGITVFVDGCKRYPIMGESENTPSADLMKDPAWMPGEKALEMMKPVFNSISPVKREHLVSDEEGINGKAYRGSTACVPKLYTTINEIDGNIFEVFTFAKQGCTSNIGTITGLTSLCLRSGIKVEDIIKELKGNNCSACMSVKKTGKKVANSCGACIGEALDKYYRGMDKTPIKDLKVSVTVDAKELKATLQELSEGLIPCPECGKRTMKPEGKCGICIECGFSRCD